MAGKQLRRRRPNIPFWYACILAHSVLPDTQFRSGFSRGAYQMRVLAAMIKKVYTSPFTTLMISKTRQVGLIKRGNDWQIPK